MGSAFRSRISLPGLFGVLSAIVVYLGAGFLVYAALSDVPIEPGDPALYGTMLAWPAILVVWLVRWIVLGALACLAVIAGFVVRDALRDRRGGGRP